jgi:hypothetical protein
MEPLREMLENMGGGGNGAGRSEGEITSRALPHGSVEADIRVETAHFDQRWSGTSWAWACLTFVHRRDLAWHEGRFEVSTSLAGRIHLAGRAWIGMCDHSYSVWYEWLRMVYSLSRYAKRTYEARSPDGCATGTSCNSPAELVATGLSLFGFVLSDAQVWSSEPCMRKMRYTSSSHNHMAELYLFCVVAVGLRRCQRCETAIRHSARLGSPLPKVRRDPLR